MTRKAILGAVVVALLLITSGLSGAVGPATTGAGAADASSAPLAQETTTTQGEETTTEAGETTQGEESANATASIEFNDQPSNGSAVVVNQTNMSEGGFVAVFAQNGTLLGNSSYLESGSHENVTVELNVSISGAQVVVATPHMDTNDNQAFDFNATRAQEVGPANATDGPYIVNGIPVSDVAFVTTGNESVQRTTTEARSARL